jgi:hypothetical protein
MQRVGAMSTIERVKIAFRKLKASVYFDKTTLPLRDKVVEFEASDDFRSKLEAIATAYDNATLGADSALVSEILVSILAMPFPKKMRASGKSDDSVISVGNPKATPEVEELQYFIDMNVQGHILGILWIMEFGKRLDDECYPNALGNRLRKKLIWNEDSDKIKQSPALFEPYFAQYSLWRDGGLTCAEKLLANKQDVLILTLDLKKYYYNTGITSEAFNDILGNDTLANKALHKAVFAIIERYTKVLDEQSVKHSGNVLPIGFLPSAVLSNWCLAKFDKGMLDFWNPAYYGRYVDDIIIVEKFEKGSEIYNKARDNSLTKDFVIDYYLGGSRRKDSTGFAVGHQETNLEGESETIYRVNSVYCLSESCSLEFQSLKTRIIALFAENNSTALISKFKQEIFENVSEFRLMPEVGEAFSQDDFSQFYRLDNDATINKLRGVRNIAMDKYELSKFLGKYRVVSSLVDDGSTKKFTRIIGKMFNDRELIDNYILWERVFEIFITDKDYDGFIKFAKRIKKAIDTLTVCEKSRNNAYATVKTNLYHHLTATLNRVLSLLWGENGHKIMSAICDSDIVLTLRNAYIETYMSNKYVMAVPSEIVVCPVEYSVDGSINLTDFDDSFKYLCSRKTFEFLDDAMLPYFRQAQDIATAMLLKTICPQCSTAGNVSYKDYVREMKDNVPDVPLEVLKDIDNRLVSIKGNAQNKLKIAIANVNVAKVSDLENVLKGRKPNRKYARYRALANLVNEAIKEKADVLVLPENYVPFEWLSALATKAAREGLAVITGVEHMIVGKKVYNYTAVLLPFRYFKTIPTAAVFFQLKKHYAPEEKRIIEGYGAEPICESEKRPLYHWRDCYFPVYCCYELTSITERAEFMSWADMILAVEYNRDTTYFSNIVESLARDLHCFFVQVNTSQYGDSRITQPTRSEEQNLVAVKGGLNQSLLIGEIDIQALREFQIKDYSLQKNGVFKPTPPGIDAEIVRDKINRQRETEKYSV